MTRIHATAIVDGSAELAGDVEIGPFAVIGPQVQIGPGTRVGAHAVIDGLTSIGHANIVGPFCSLGGPPQDMKYAGEPTALTIGDRNVIREYCFFNVGTVQDAGATRIGDDNWIMAYVHVAHDCQIGDHVIIANSTQLAGHVHIGDWAMLGGLTGVHQFVKIGAHAMTAAHSMLTQDLPPFVTCAGNPATPKGINVEGLRRRGFAIEEIAAIRGAYKVLYRSGLTLDAARSAIAALERNTPGVHARLDELVRFVDSAARGIVR